MKRELARWALGTATVLLCHCNPNEPPSTQPAPGSAAEPQSTLVVFAASSLREAFGVLGSAFEATRPGTSVSFHFAGSQQLRVQIEHGAEADVFASADLQQLQALGAAHWLQDTQIFARNQPVLAVSKERAGEIRRFADLPRAARVVIGAPEVPVGRYTSQLLDRAELALGSRFRAEVEARVVSRELNVRQVLSKVSSGEADAGIVYRSDLTGVQGGVSMVRIPAELNVSAEYPIARLRASARPQLAREFIAVVLSPVGQSALEKAGFERATAGRVTP